MSSQVEVSSGDARKRLAEVQTPVKAKGESHVHGVVHALVPPGEVRVVVKVVQERVVRAHAAVQQLADKQIHVSITA